MPRLFITVAGPSASTSAVLIIARLRQRRLRLHDLLRSSVSSGFGCVVSGVQFSRPAGQHSPRGGRQQELALNAIRQAVTPNHTRNASAERQALQVPERSPLVTPGPSRPRRQQAARVRHTGVSTSLHAGVQDAPGECPHQPAHRRSLPQLLHHAVPG